MTNDELSVVLVKRNNLSHPSDESALQENLYYDGNLNPFIFQRYYDLSLRCKLEFFHFPFDHQLCNIEVSYIYTYTRIQDSTPIMLDTYQLHFYSSSL